MGRVGKRKGKRWGDEKGVRRREEKRVRKNGIATEVRTEMEVRIKMGRKG